MRILASQQNTKGIQLEGRGDISGAIAAYRRSITRDPTWSVPWYNLGLLFKRQNNWPESFQCNERAVELNPSDEAAWWNLGIAATALAKWTRARDAWRACGIHVPEGEGPIEMQLGPVPIRLHPPEAAEVVWCKRIDPARAIVWNVPLPESRHRYGDLILHDGARNGSRVSNGVEIPVFDELELLQPSVFGTFVVTVSGVSRGQVEQLVDRAVEQQLQAEDWSSKIQWLCRECSEGRVEHSHESEEQPERRIGVAASSEAEVRRLIEPIFEESASVYLHSIECAIAPVPLQ